MINSSITSKKDIVSNPGYIIQHPRVKGYAYCSTDYFFITE